VPATQSVLPIIQTDSPLPAAATEAALQAHWEAGASGHVQGAHSKAKGGAGGAACSLSMQHLADANARLFSGGSPAAGSPAARHVLADGYAAMFHAHVNPSQALNPDSPGMLSTHQAVLMSLGMGFIGAAAAAAAEAEQNRTLQQLQLLRNEAAAGAAAVGATASTSAHGAPAAYTSTHGAQASSPMTLASRPTSTHGGQAGSPMTMSSTPAAQLPYAASLSNPSSLSLFLRPPQ
jgi:hypothetical protein